LKPILMAIGNLSKCRSGQLACFIILFIKSVQWPVIRNKRLGPFFALIYVVQLFKLIDSKLKVKTVVNRSDFP
jgi:hypothetical protein